MKAVCAVTLLCTLLLSACRGVPVTEARSPERQGGTREPSEGPEMTASTAPQPLATPDLAIYLTAEGVTPADLLPEDAGPEGATRSLEEIPLQAGPLLTLVDIVSYDAVTHAFTLTAEATERLAQLAIPVAGPPFVLTVDDQPIYGGAFWTPLSSLSYDGVVIMLMPTGEPAFETYRIELGYPGPDFFRGEDPRGDPR
ncbi:MAG: hypothetical protein ACP5HG_18450, partial [Anaerolineae bacterium]